MHRHITKVIYSVDNDPCYDTIKCFQIYRVNVDTKYIVSQMSLTQYKIVYNNSAISSTT